MKKFVHVGCGANKKHQTTKGFNTDEWQEIRFDIDESVEPDLVGTMTDMRVVATESVDALFSSHNIEHLYPHDVPVALKEFHRVIKTDGYVVITCPDLRSVCRLVAEDKLTEPAYQSFAGAITPLDILYGHRAAMAQGNLFMAHRCGFTKTTLTMDLLMAGFPSVGVLEKESDFSLWAIASKTELADDEVRELFKQHFFN